MVTAKSDVMGSVSWFTELHLNAVIKSPKGFKFFINATTPDVATQVTFLSEHLRTTSVIAWPKVVVATVMEKPTRMQS
jgi:hypothetical protein